MNRATTRSAQGNPKGDHWEEYWRDAGGDGEILGGPRQRQTLEAFWADILAAPDREPTGLSLEIACGAAPVARFAAAQIGPDAIRTFVCADYAPSALFAARRALGPKARLVACDARDPPFQAGSFDAVYSQYGLEYAGNSAFETSSRLLRPGGHFAAVVHYRDGAIESECRSNARLIDGALAAGLLEAPRRALSASYAVGTRGGAPRKDPSAEKALAGALSAVRGLVATAPDTSAKTLVARYAADIARIAERRLAFAPKDALGWIDAVEGRLKAYAARMSAMVGAARSRDDLEEIAAALSAAGLADIDFAPLIFSAADAPGAWRLKARRPR